jgi:DNA polymerase (family 10)
MGTKKIENMNRALKLFKENERILYKEAFVIGNEILAAIQQIEGIKNADIAGSLRRKKETIGDIDIIIEAEMKDRKKILKNILSLQQVSKLIEAGITKATIILKNKNIQVDIRFVNADEYGAAMLYFTGSKEHNIKMRIIARNKGYKLNEYGLFEITTGKKNVGTTEASIYNALGLKYIPPELRIGKDEIKNAVIQEKELV